MSCIIDTIDQSAYQQYEKCNLNFVGAANIKALNYFRRVIHCRTHCASSVVADVSLLFLYLMCTNVYLYALDCFIFLIFSCSHILVIQLAVRMHKWQHIDIKNVGTLFLTTLQSILFMVLNFSYSFVHQKALFPSHPCLNTIYFCTSKIYIPLSL